MKKHLLMAGLLALPWLVPAQNDAANLRKYWNLRHDLRERYTKIGSASGEILIFFFWLDPKEPIACAKASAKAQKSRSH